MHMYLCYFRSSLSHCRLKCNRHRGTPFPHLQKMAKGVPPYLYIFDGCRGTIKGNTMGGGRRMWADWIPLGYTTSWKHLFLRFKTPQPNPNWSTYTVRLVYVTTMIGHGTRDYMYSSQADNHKRGPAQPRVYSSPSSKSAGRVSQLEHVSMRSEH